MANIGLSQPNIFPSRFTGAVTKASPTPKFGGQNTFLVPDASEVWSVPGMFGPKASVIPLSTNFLTHGLPSSVVPTKIPGVGIARRFRPSTDWLISQIKRDRVVSTQQNIHHLLRQVKQAGHDQDKQLLVVQTFFGLDGSQVGQSLNRGLLKLCRNKGLLHDLARLNVLGDNEDVLATVLGQVRETLRDALPESTAKKGSKAALAHQALEEKILNRVVDRISPRRVLVGHSLGGVISYKSLQERTGDIAMVISLGSPLNGTVPVPESIDTSVDAVLKTIGPERFTLRPFKKIVHQSSKALTERVVKSLVDLFFPAIPQMRQGSQSVQNLQEEAIPFDTTAISISNPEDGLVGVENARHNDKKPAHLNLQVSPEESSLSELIDGKMLKLLNINPVGHLIMKALDEHETFKGLRHHCGLVANYDQYWGENGELMQQVYEGPDAAHNLRTLLGVRNYEPMREEILQRMLKRLQGDDAKHYQALYAPLVDVLKKATAMPLPFANGSNKLAEQVLKALAA